MLKPIKAVMIFFKFKNTIFFYAIAFLYLLPFRIYGEELGTNDENIMRNVFSEQKTIWMKSNWKGTLKDGTIIGPHELEKILIDHERWLATNGGEGIRADLTGANLKKAQLDGVNLCWAILNKTDFSEARMFNSLFIQAEIKNASLKKAVLSNATLNGANFQNSDLTDVDLEDSDLSGVNFSNARLTGANLRGSDLKDATLINTRLDDIIGIDWVIKSLKDSGSRHLERLIIYEKKKKEQKIAWKGDLGNKADFIINWLLFDWTCKFGYCPLRPLFILMISIFGFSIFYIVSLILAAKDGIWLIWIPDRLRSDQGEDKPKKLHLKLGQALAVGFQFSIYSAFTIGWKDLNVANWLSRIQSKEYTLRSSGWVRTLSGIQSIFSVFLLAIWILSYFGRPFQ